MNKKEVELTKYFDNMCIIFNTKKVMFSEWEKYFKKLKETINNLYSYYNGLIWKSQVIHSLMIKQRMPVKIWLILRLFLDTLKYNLNGYTFFLYIFLFG